MTLFCCTFVSLSHLLLMESESVWKRVMSTSSLLILFLSSFSLFSPSVSSSCDLWLVTCFVERYEVDATVSVFDQSSSFVFQEGRPVVCTEDQEKKGNKDSRKSIHSKGQILCIIRRCINIKDCDTGITAVSQLEVFFLILLILHLLYPHHHHLLLPSLRSIDFTLRKVFSLCWVEQEVDSSASSWLYSFSAPSPSSWRHFRVPFNLVSEGRGQKRCIFFFVDAKTASASVFPFFVSRLILSHSSISCLPSFQSL